MGRCPGGLRGDSCPPSGSRGFSGPSVGFFGDAQQIKGKIMSKRIAKFKNHHQHWSPIYARNDKNMELSTMSLGVPKDHYKIHASTSTN